MDRDKIIQEINEFLLEEFEAEGEIKPGDDVMERLELDSLDLVDLIVVIEKQFGVKVNGEDFIHLRTFDKFYDYIIERMENK